MVSSPVLSQHNSPQSNLAQPAAGRPDSTTSLMDHEQLISSNTVGSDAVGFSLGAVNRARGLLLAASATWGTYPVVLRALYNAPGPKLPPLFIVAARFMFTALMLTAIQVVADTRESLHSRNDLMTSKSPGVTRRRTIAMANAIAPSVLRPAREHRAAFELACIGLTGNFLSVWGISHVAATIAETLLGCVHIFVPLLTVVLGGARTVGLRTWQACAISFSAVCVAAAGAYTAGATSYSLGLAACIGSAYFYALGRVRTQQLVGVQRVHASTLNRQRWAYKAALASSALLLDAWRLPRGASRSMLAQISLVSRSQWLLMLTSCLTAGVIGSSLQFEAQKVLPAASIQPFLALQPLFACGWSSIFLAEPVAPAMLAGGTLMVAGALLASTDASTVA